MIVLAVVRGLLRRHAVFLGVCAFLLGGFELVITAVIATLDLPQLIGGVIAMLPPGVGSAMTEQLFGGLSAAGLIGFGWNHPVAHATGTALAVVLGSRAIAGEIENGTLELTLSQPISRTRYFAANLGFSLLALALLSTVGLAGTLLGVRLFGVDAPPATTLALLALNYLLLLLALHAITLLASAFGRDGGRALGLGFLVAVGSFLATTIALLWPAASFLEPWALHSWYVPRDVIASGAIGASSLVVLLGTTTLAVAAALWRFRTRDVP